MNRLGKDYSGRTKEQKLCWKPKHERWCANWIEGDEHSVQEGGPTAEGEAGETHDVEQWRAWMAQFTYEVRPPGEFGSEAGGVERWSVWSVPTLGSSGLFAWTKDEHTATWMCSNLNLFAKMYRHEHGMMMP